jgi:hypothetical protein
MIQAIVHVPFDCPQCSCSYHVELDLFKLTRLNRVAVCGRCHCEFDVSIRLNRGEVGSQDDTAPPPRPAPSPPPAAARKPAQRPRKAPMRQRTKPDGLGLTPAMLAAMSKATEVEPKLRGQPTEPDLPRFETQDDAPGEPARDAMPTEPSLRRPPEDDDGPAEWAPDQAEDDPSTQSARAATLPGTRRPAVKSSVDAHIIVEVGKVGGDAASRKTTKSLYRPSRLVTKQGLGVPAHLLQRSEKEGQP